MEMGRKEFRPGNYESVGAGMAEWVPAIAIGLVRVESRKATAMQGWCGVV